MSESSYEILSPKEYASFATRAVPLDGESEYAALIGLIISNFAHIERELPTIVARMTGLSQTDSVAVFAHFRAFSARLGVLEALLALRAETSHDRIIYSHCKGLMNEANGLRNRYAHAKYGKGKVMMMLPYPNDLLGPEKWIESPIEAVKKDKQRVSTILWELFAILHQKNLPKTLYDKLLPEDR